MFIIKEEFRKMYPFLLMLVLLYALNLGFNMLYDWGGVSVIVRVYIMVLSCFVVYSFSQHDTESLKETYLKEYGENGKLYLFLVLRIFPFFFIYLMTVVFTLINYVQSADWPVDTFLKLMDGRYSNTVIYALILFIVLRLKIRPGISIPVFIAVAVFYFYTDKLLYKIFDPGAGISVIKLSKFAVFYFILVYGYTKRRYRILFSSAIASAAGFISFAILILAYYMVFTFSDPGGRIYINSAETFLKYGFNSVFDSYEKAVEEHRNVNDVVDLIVFAEKGGRDITFTTAVWEKFVTDSEVTDADKIYRYLYKNSVILSFPVIKEYVLKQAKDNPDYLLENRYLKRYLSLYYSERSKDFFSIYKDGDITVKELVIDSLGYVRDYDAIQFLINRLTDTDRKISEGAYESLKKITGLDPAEPEKKEFHDLDVVDKFRDYAEKLRKG